MKQKSSSSSRTPPVHNQGLLEHVQVVLVTEPKARRLTKAMAFVTHQHPKL